MAAREAHALLVAIEDYVGAYGGQTEFKELTDKLKDVEAQVSEHMDAPAQAAERTPGRQAADDAAESGREEKEKASFDQPTESPKDFDEAGQEARRRFAGESRSAPFGRKGTKSPSTPPDKNPNSPQKDPQPSSEPAPAAPAAS